MNKEKLYSAFLGGVGFLYMLWITVMLFSVIGNTPEKVHAVAIGDVIGFLLIILVFAMSWKAFWNFIDLMKGKKSTEKEIRQDQTIQVIAQASLDIDVDEDELIRLRDTMMKELE